MSTVASGLVLLALLAVAGGLFARRAHLLYRIVRLGKPVDRAGEVGRRVRNEATERIGGFRRRAPTMTLSPDAPVKP